MYFFTFSRREEVWRASGTRQRDAAHPIPHNMVTHICNTHYHILFHASRIFNGNRNHTSVPYKKLNSNVKPTVGTSRRGGPRAARRVAGLGWGPGVGSSKPLKLLVAGTQYGLLYLRATARYGVYWMLR